MFRLGRAKGVTLTTIDASIVAIALEHHVSVFTLDKDFFRIARFTGLSAALAASLSPARDSWV
ncbi:MAG: hypothetical protein DMG35_19000 [Acidobacteria bacterium]|nr:MAG: hypothetical protein DMG35_19000 [Acidobacteriota bacterium]